ncbi:MAG: hypothetical protein V1835_02205 [Candidatus Micrarchaeota archaeon]
MYSREIERLLNAQQILEGDEVEVLSEGRSRRGVLLPRISEVQDDTLTLKLPNGYNIGIKYSPGMQIKK